MPTPKQHAKGVLRSLRNLIADLQAAELEGVYITFTDDVEPDAENLYRLNNVPHLAALTPSNIGVRAAVTNAVVVAADEPDSAV